jgi:sugar phosphate isomerase/epimerase
VIVAVSLGSKEFFEADPPYDNDELLRSVRKASSLGFEAVQVGPLGSFVRIEGGRLRTVLDSLNISRNVHVGGLYDAEKFVATREEYVKARKEVHYGVMLCRKIGSTLVSVHPPFFATESLVSEKLQFRAKIRFLELLEEEVDFASRNNIKIALESFCYYPFIFEGLNDFAQFVSKFPSEKLGVLLDVGHVYQIGIDLSDALQTFGDRLLDIHVHDATRDKDYRKATHLPIGRGTINFPNFLNLLREVRYDGWLTLEVRGSEKEVVQSKQFLESLLASGS